MGAAMESTQLKTQNRLRIFWRCAARQVQQALDQVNTLQCIFALEQGLVQRDDLLECLLSCSEVLRGTVLPQNSPEPYLSTSWAMSSGSSSGLVKELLGPFLLNDHVHKQISAAASILQHFS